MSEEQAQASQGPNLTIGDLVLTAQIIQAAASKGVFRAEELKSVGDYYDRLIGFLESTGAVQRAPIEQPAQPTATPETTKEKANAKTRRKA